MVIDYRQTAAISSITLEPATLYSHATSPREAVLKFHTLLPHPFNCKYFTGAHGKEKKKIKHRLQQVLCALLGSENMVGLQHLLHVTCPWC